MENRIVFSKNGSYVWYEFPNNEHKDSGCAFTDKDSAIEAGFQYLDRKIITMKELKNYIFQIMSSKKLECKNKDGLVLVRGMAFVNFPENIIDPYFEISTFKGEPCGYFINGDDKKMSGPMYNKNIGRECLENFLKSRKIDQRTYTSLSVLLNLSRLPEQSLRIVK